MTLATIGDVTEFVVDGTHASPARTESGVPVLSAQNVNTGRLDFETDRFTSSAEYDAFRRRLELKKGDVLLTIVGSIGRSAVLDDEIGPVVFQRSVAILRPRPDRLSSRFLYHAIQSADFQSQLSRASNQSSQAGVYLGKLKTLKVPCPPLSAQRRIAEILDKADALRAKRRAVLAQLDILAQSIFLDIFGAPSANESSWPLIHVGDVAGVQGGLQVSAARKGYLREVPYLRVANVFRGYLDLKEIKLIRASDSEIARTTLLKDDLLIVEGHGNPAEIGRAALWDGSIPGCVHQNHLIRARFDAKSINPLYACTYLNSPFGRRHLLGAGKTTSGLNTINVSEVRSTPIPMPPMALQLRFANQLSAIGRHKAVCRTASLETDALFASLQHRAFRGEL